MIGSIFTETLRHHWRQMLYWGLSIGLFGYFIMVVIPDVAALNQYAALLESLPPFMLQMFGAENAVALTTPIGFVAFGFSTYAMLILAVYAILAGLNITANEEEAGILDVVLSLPAARAEVILERFAAYAVITTGIAVMIALGLLIGSSVTALELDRELLVLGALNLVPATLLLMAFTVCVAAWTRRRSQAQAIMLIYLVGSFFMNFITRAVTHTVTDTIGRLSFFTYYDGQAVMTTGLHVTNLIVLFGLMIYLLWGAVWLFERRDVGV